MKLEELPIKGYPYSIVAESIETSQRVCVIVDRPSNSAYWSYMPEGFSIKSKWSEFDFKELPNGGLANVPIPEIEENDPTFREWLKQINY